MIDCSYYPRSARLVADYVRGGPWKAFIEQFSHDANVCIHVGDDNHGRVDVGDPKLAQCAAKCRQKTCGHVEA